MVVPDDYYPRLLTAIEANTPINNVKANEISSKTILSVDLGRVDTKICISREPNNVVFISAHVKHIPFEEIFNGSIYKYTSIPSDPLMNLWLEYKGSGYAIGKLAAKLGANLGIGQSKVEDALVKILAAVGYFKLKDEISLVIGLPFLSLEQFKKEKTQLISMITGPHLMKFRGESIYLNISKVWVMPDGYGSLLWTEAQPQKRASLPDFTKITVAIVDIGHQCIDLLMVDNYRFVRDASKSEDFGMNKFYELIAAEIEGADSQSLRLISATIKSKGERFYRPKGAIKATNLDDFLPNLIEMFSREICSRILAWLDQQEDWIMHPVTNVIITGGGGQFFWEDVQRLLKEAKINAYLAAPSRQANALGQFIYGEAQLSAKCASRAED
ncbi:MULTISPECIES: ParM/StbA family protein [Calothrix]|uniref:ParM/StbA family protein n=1 Tax=Calothrix TaxID=1186 RepID=UPI0036F317CE